MVLDEINDALGDEHKDVILTINSDGKQVTALIDDVDVEVNYEHIGRLAGNRITNVKIETEATDCEIIDK